MHNPDFIEGKLAARTNAATSDREGKNNRWHYRLVFDERIGWDWLEKQVEEAAYEIGAPLEPYKFGPVENADAMVVEVRELRRREGIDDNQKGLTAFEVDE